MKNFILVLLVFSSTLSFAQRKFLFVNSEPVDNKRYDHVKGSPMIFDEWVRGTIIDEDGAKYENVLLNYNGYTEAFEVKDGDDKFIILSPEMYTKVIVKDPVAKKHLGLEFMDEIVFKKVLHPDMKDMYALSVFEGKGYQLLKYFVSNIVTTKKNIPGEIVEINRFNPKDVMVLFDHGLKFEFVMKKRNMKKNLPDHYELDKWNKKSRKLDVYSYEGFIERLKDLVEKG